MPRAAASSLRRTAPLLGGVLLLLALVAVGCGSSTGGSGGSGVDVVATSTQLGDIVRNVGGDAADVHQILQPNTDPHEYEPRPDDVKATAGAKVVFESGDDLDGWMGKIVSEAGGHPQVVTLADTNVDRVPGETSGPEASRYDPHWWHDPHNVEAAIPAVAAALTRANPAGAHTYAANAARYLAAVRALDARIRACVARVPAAQRKLVTSHDAFNYFAKRYGIDVVGAVIPSQTTQAQPSAASVVALTRQIEREHVRAIYPESSINPKLADAIARQTGARSDLRLYGDTLGPKGSRGATYLTMEQANADAMVDGFTGGKVRCR
jgi:ABC-type Zn uptake system ZnuABC Zn-binding protein ZnuA